MVYGHLIDISHPKVIPEIEPMMPPPPPSMPPLPPSPPRIRRRKMSKHSPFAGNYLFDPVIMGFSLSREIKYFFITKTPFYFRGCQNAEQLGQVLRVHMPFGKGKRVRDVVRRLRVYLRCESHGFYLSSLPTGLPYFETLEDRRRRGERHMYDSYGLRLKALRDLPYDKHKIKLEICIFHDLCSGLGAKDEDDRHKYNLLETVKPTYAHAKEGGADVAVRYENFHTGAGSDVSWELDLDEEASSEVRVFRKQPQASSVDSYEQREPDFIHDIHENTPARRAWLEKIAAARTANPDRFSVPNISWKHALVNGPFSACVCEACDKDKFRFSVDSIPVGVGTFPVNAFPVDAPLTSCNFGPDTLFPHTPEDFEFDGGDFDFSHVPEGVGDL
tara:strand:- start:38185 stop:39348 length:1164 start_codon:yes stop_codon:yes gene_type:complete